MTARLVRLLAGFLPFFLPPVARLICARAGLDRAVLVDRDHGFDVQHYERSAGRRFRTHQAALIHYLLVGSHTGLQPRPGFDPAGYRRRNPDIGAAGYEAFAHYFRFGRHEGRSPDAEADGPVDDALRQPDLSRMLQRPPRETKRARVDIVMPVYGNRRLTLRAIDSVLASHPVTPHELIVIDDGSPEPGLRRDLELLADRGHLTLLANKRNLGFVRTANRGFALHPDRDVVLLNSDTEVYGDWLDRLMAALHSTLRTATASPLSNSATMLSYPIFLRDNNRLSGMDFAALDRLLARLAHAPVELPTALGFCMAVRRGCLADIGPFDEENFGRGYGEENDFSQRAMAAGWRHVAAANVFVWHRGGASFGPEREALIEAAQQTLEKLHPGYAASIQRFIARDPLRLVRETLDIARIRDDPRRRVLYVGGWPGQVGNDALAMVVVPEIGPFYGQFRLFAPGVPPTPNLARFRARVSTADVVRMLQALDVREVQLQNGGLHRSDPLRVLTTAAARIAGLPVRTGTGGQIAAYQTGKSPPIFNHR